MLEEILQTVGQNMTLMTLATLIGASGGWAVHWLLQEDWRRSPLVDPGLKPDPPAIRQPGKVGTARTLLQAFVQDMRTRMDETELAAACPVHVTGASLLAWTDRVIPLEHEVDPWTIEYDGGPTATARTRDGVRMCLDARQHARKGPGKGLTLAIIRTAEGTQHLVHVPAREGVATVQFMKRGVGRFVRFDRIREIEKGMKRLTTVYETLGAA